MKTQKFNNILFNFTTPETRLGRGVLEAILQDVFLTELNGTGLSESLPSMTITMTQTKESHNSTIESWWKECFKINSIKFNN